MTTPPDEPAPDEATVSDTANGGWAPIAPVNPDDRAARRRTWLTHGATAAVALFVGGVFASGIATGADADERTDGKEESTAAAQPTVTVTVTATKTVTATPTAQPAPTVVVTETTTAAPEPSEEEGPASRFAGSGEYLVGEDIKPGTYKTDGPAGSFSCYWERAKDSSGEFDSIITNNNLDGPGRVTLRKGEIFKTSRCQEWQSVG
ncbi:hypothetical protein ACWFQ8_01720 [Streptomyces sp. NPDC055254]